MSKNLRGGLLRLLLPLLVLMLACSLSPSIPLTGGNSGYSFDPLPGKARQNPAIANNQAISKWSSTTVTYAFLNGTDQLPGDTEQEVIQRAFAVWAAQVPLTFTQVGNQGDANIVISWATGDHGDGDPFDGPGDVLAHSTFPNPYDDRQVFLHFDDAEHWVDSISGDVDLETVAIHEIGHTLGLDHSDDPNAIMYPSYDGPHRTLGADDIAGIQELYGVASTPR
jgi:predicted Zn-dependent protease